MINITRRALLQAGLLGTTTTGMALSASIASADVDNLPEPVKGDDGLYKQDWFLQSFLDLKDDLTEAAADSKGFAVLFEQNGCPYCREMHRVNLANPEIRNYITTNFVVLQLDMWGSRRVTDFDGEELGERELALRWRVTGTPTFVFFPTDPALVNGKSGREAEVWRLLGYWIPFHFLSTFQYVHGGHYKDKHFQRFIQTKADRLRAEGKDVDIW